MKTALISGTSRRLGLYLTENLLKDGWYVHAVTRHSSPELLALDCEQLHIHELGEYSEVRVERFIAHLRQSCSTLDLLINNASIYMKDDQLMAQGPQFYQSLTFIHMMLPTLLVSGLIDHLNEAKGNIVSITDIYADNPNADYSLYCSTKAGLQNLTLGFAKKFAPKLRANCIQPGPIKFLDEHDEAYKAQILKETPLGIEGGFDPIYKTLQFILNNPYITGACIKVDGGRSLVRG